MHTHPSHTSIIFWILRMFYNKFRIETRGKSYKPVTQVTLLQVFWTPACCPVHVCKRLRDMMHTDKTAAMECSTHTAPGLTGFSLYISSVKDLELFLSPRGETGIIVMGHYKTPICITHKALNLLLTILELISESGIPPFIKPVVSSEAPGPCC